MAHVSDLISEDILAYLKSHETKSMLRFITCGSVDDGKSTLIGRLLYESSMLFEDQLAALESESKKSGTQGANLDFALLLDGLTAEREQGITIDVAYRYFSTDRRKFIVADTPGHEQYTRNMITGASTADCAVVLIDARKGVLTQTRRHSYLVSLIGIRHVAVAVNKMDLVGYSQERFEEIEAAYRVFAAEIGIEDVTCIPLSGLTGANVVEQSAEMPWYTGPALLPYLEAVEIDDERMQRAPFRLPVQWVNRPDLDFRGFSGTIAGGTVSPGDRIVALPSGQTSEVARIVTYDGDLELAVAGQSITLTLTDEIDISRGDVIAKADARPSVADQFESTIIWMADEPMLPGRNYLMRIGGATATATITPLKYKLNVNSLERLAATKLELNEIGVCAIELDRPIAFDSYSENRETGGFILIDRITSNTVGAGLLHFALRRADNVHWQAIDVDKDARSQLAGQRPCIVWLTGLSGAGQVDDREPRRAEAARARQAHLPAGRRQRPPRPQQGPRLHRRRPRRERPARRRGRAADGGRRADRPRVVHLALPRRAAERARARRRRRVHRGLRRRLARGRRGARPEGPVRQGPPRRARELHGRGLPVRAARASGAAPRHGHAHARRGGRPGRRGTRASRGPRPPERPARHGLSPQADTAASGRSRASAQRSQSPELR